MGGGGRGLEGVGGGGRGWEGVGGGGRGRIGFSEGSGHHSTLLIGHSPLRVSLTSGQLIGAG